MGECCSNIYLERTKRMFFLGERKNEYNECQERKTRGQPLKRFCEDISNISRVILGSDTTLKGSSLKYVYMYVMGKYGEWSFKVVSRIYKENLGAGVE